MMFSNYYNYIVENQQMDIMGKKLADKYDIIYNGWWESPMDKFTFTDKETKSTFLTIDEDELIDKLKSLRLDFESDVPVASWRNKE